MSQDGIQINGRFEKWLLGIFGSLVAAGVISMVVMAVQLGEIRTSLVWFKEAFIKVERKVDHNDERIDALERDAGR